MRWWLALSVPLVCMAAGRGVHKLSTMERAIGGPAAFPAHSPAVILANALRSAGPGVGGNVADMARQPAVGVPPKNALKKAD
jgi:hypothetical protein